jgi:glycosyltransferase involved in cell wall biosynthesis
MTRENGVAPDTFVTLPVCADGDAFREKTNYLRQKLEISTDRIIVLYAGFLAEWALCEEIAIVAKTWPENYLLVLHGHGYHDTEYVQKLRQHEGDKVRLSDSPVAYDELPALLASADIGIALYRDLGSNFTRIGSASGKLAHYLKSGLPVIVNDYPNISRIIGKYNCGIGVGGAGAIGDAVAYINKNYDKMREGAFHCYENEFRFSKHFQKVLTRMGMT